VVHGVEAVVVAIGAGKDDHAEFHGVSVILAERGWESRRARFQQLCIPQGT
jgi:hypothetical protein